MRVSISLIALSHLGVAAQERSSTSFVRLPLQKITSLRCNLFFGTISIGGQEFKMLLDTGGSTSWVPGVECDVKTHGMHPRYDHSKSATYEEDGRRFDARYGSGAISGDVSRDTMRIGGMTIQGQLFVQADNIALGDELGHNCYAKDLYDGVLGLAGIERHGESSPIGSMVEQQLVPEPVLGLYFQDTPVPRGEATFGGIDHSYYSGSLVELPMLSHRAWEVSLDAISFGQSAIVSLARTAVIDSATSYLCGPSTAVAKLAQQVNATAILVPGHPLYTYIIECTSKASLPDLTLTLAGKNFTLSHDDYVLNIGEQCVFSFAGYDAPGRPIWILGYPFLQAYFCAFDFGARIVRIAPAAKQHTNHIGYPAESLITDQSHVTLCSLNAIGFLISALLPVAVVTLALRRVWRGAWWTSARTEPLILER